VHEPVAQPHQVASESELPCKRDPLTDLLDVAFDEIINRMLKLKVFFADNRTFEVSTLRAVSALEEVNPNVFVGWTTTRSRNSGIGSANRYVRPERLIITRSGWFDRKV